MSTPLWDYPFWYTTMRGSLVVPTLNEAESIGHVLRQFRTAAEAADRTLFSRDPVEWEMIVVDGNSTDGTAELARAEGARVLQEARPGYGQAYLTGFSEARGDVIATLDGDATYPADLVPTFVRKLMDDRLDFITCDRMAYLDRRAMTTEHRIGNWVLNLALQLAYRRFLREVPGETLNDSQSGMWIFRREILERLKLTQPGMAFSEEIKLEALLRGFRVEEVPIHYAERWGAPKLSSWRDGSKNLLFLLTKRLDVAREIRRSERVQLTNRSDSAPR